MLEQRFLLSSRGSLPPSEDPGLVLREDGFVYVVTPGGAAESVVIGLPAGLVFPDAPGDAEVFYRTDRRLLYEYEDSLGRWVTLDQRDLLFTGSELQDGAAGSGIYGWVPAFDDVYVEKFRAMTRAGATNDGNNYFAVVCNALASGAATVPIASFTTAFDRPNDESLHTSTVDAVFPAGTLFELVVTATGSPSRIDIPAALLVRSCG